MNIYIYITYNVLEELNVAQDKNDKQKYILLKRN